MTEVFLGREALGDGVPRHELRRWCKQREPVELLVDHGFATPETQIAVSGGDGVTALLDMGWRDLRLAVEHDGAHHQRDRVQYLKDRRRLPGLTGLDWEVRQRGPAPRGDRPNV